MYKIIEIIIYFSWVCFLLIKLKDKNKFFIEEMIVSLGAIPFVIIMEIYNEVIHSGLGMYYPNSLFYFPGYNFPTAIVLIGSLYVYIIYLISQRILIKLIDKDRYILFNIMQIIVILMLLTSCYLIEFLGLKIGYWKKHINIGYNLKIALFTYTFYMLFTIPSIIIAKIYKYFINRNN